ncbi:hypothetical protein [Lentzea sp. NPDC059081]|uniref:hypothetical protein n=1 Tax=Lentzea sp. NPDC059081 TaxID=3346719 RepID=UPI00367FFAE3
MGDLRFVRYQAVEPNARGTFPGIFGLVNGLRRDGRLTAEQEAFMRVNNAWYDAAYTDPSTVDPTVYDRELNPGAHAWFKAEATHLLERVHGYLALLDAHGVRWARLTSDAPGRVVYEDEVQVVVVPVATPASRTPPP